MKTKLHLKDENNPDDDVRLRAVYQVFGRGISFGQSSPRDYTIHMCLSNFILSCGMIGQSCDICVETGSVMIERSQNPTQ